MATNSAINSNQTLDTAATPTFATLALSTSGLTLLTATSTDAGAGAGPIADLYRNSASPAAADVLGQVIYNGVDSGAAKQEYARQEARIISTTAASEKGALAFYTTATGTSTKQIDLLDTGGQYRGNNTNTAPPAGFIGEVISSVVGSGAPVNLTASVISNLTSLALTPGVWDVSFALQLARTASGTNATAVDFGLSATSATIEGSVGDKWFESYSVPTGSSGVQFQYVFPPYRLLLSANTTYYAWAMTNGTLQNYNIYGRMSAVRVG